MDTSPIEPWRSDLVGAVERAFAVTGATTPGWPDPHPGLVRPRDEEYSRVSDPGKYRILAARVAAWAEVLAARGLATSYDEPRAEWLDAGELPRRDEQSLRIDPVRAGGLSLLVSGTVVDGAPFGVELGITAAGVPPVLVARLPACGCDACDDGSQRLLDELDDEVIGVVGGGVVHRCGFDAKGSVTEWRGAPWL